MKIIKTEIILDSTPKKIWNILTNFKEYEKWNPFITRIIGDAKIGSRIEVHIHTSNGKQRKYNPKITKLEIYKELRWTGKSLIPGIFDGERIFIIKSTENKVSFLHQEIFKGLGVKLIGTKLDADLLEGFNAMNEALKKRTELFL